MRIDGKPEGARQAMSWLHTWVSILFGWLLYAIFVTGTLSFFQNEITLWMQPEKHYSINTHNPSEQTAVALKYLQDNHANASAWTINLPNARHQTIDINIKAQGEDPNNRRGGKQITLNAQTGEEIKARETRGGNFLYRFHFELYGFNRIWARWLVSLATMFMFVAIISGIITHKKIFSDFFTFRPKKGQRSWLDAHNMTAVFSLPFLLMITFSGLLLFMYMLVPQVIDENYKYGRQEYFAQLEGKNLSIDELEALQEQEKQRQKMQGRPPKAPKHQDDKAPKTHHKDQKPNLNKPTTEMADMSALLAVAESQWGNNPVARINITAPNTPKAQIEMTAQNASTLAHWTDTPVLTFDGVTGKLIANKEHSDVKSSVTAVSNFLTLLHQARGVDTVLRWLLFMSGIFGTMMVATGLVLWIVKRAPEIQKAGKKHFGYRLVEVTNVATIIGLPLAILAYVWASRFVPIGIEQRAEAEIKVFFVVWLISLIHSTIRPHKKAWLEQLALAVVLFMITPLFNALTGGQALWHSVRFGQWALASFDIICVLFGVIFGYAFVKLKNHQGLTIKPKKPKTPIQEQV